MSSAVQKDEDVNNSSDLDVDQSEDDWPSYSSRPTCNVKSFTHYSLLVSKSRCVVDVGTDENQALHLPMMLVDANAVNKIQA